MLPIIGILASALAAAGGFTAYWYVNLPKDEREEADKAAAELAYSMYDKALDELGVNELRQIEAIMKRRFAS